MRTIDLSTQFRRDYKRVLKGRHAAVIEARLAEVAQALASGQPLPASRRDHALVGEWAGFRDCHLRPDVVLIYRFLDGDRVQLARIGSHSEMEIG